MLAVKQSKQFSYSALFGKHTFATVLMHACLRIGLPYLLFRLSAGMSWLFFNIGRLQHVGLALLCGGGLLYARAIWVLLRGGRSFPEQSEHTEHAERARMLRTDGVYAIIRHPILLGVVLMLVGEAIYLGSLLMLSYALLYWLGAHIFVKVREEPRLTSRFGSQYKTYCRAVPRWLPRFSTE